LNFLQDKHPKDCHLYTPLSKWYRSHRHSVYLLDNFFMRLELFHTDRGSEFKNKLIDQALETFGIERSLSEKGTPYDNAVAEATFKTIKTEFVHGRVFPSQQDFNVELFDYVNWFNNIRIHGSQTI
jgi:transposase InsO family protein